MIQDVYGIKDFQTNLPKISRDINKVGGHYLVTNRSRPTMVAIPFQDYQAIEDIFLELNSPQLQKDIKKGGKHYLLKNTKSFKKILKEDE